MLQNSDFYIGTISENYLRKSMQPLYFSLSFCDGICEDYIPLTDVIVKFIYVVVYRDNGILGYSYRLWD